VFFYFVFILINHSGRVVFSNNTVLSVSGESESMNKRTHRNHYYAASWVTTIQTVNT